MQPILYYSYTTRLISTPCAEGFDTLSNSGEDLLPWHSITNPSNPNRATSIASTSAHGSRRLDDDHVIGAGLPHEERSRARLVCRGRRESRSEHMSILTRKHASGTSHAKDDTRMNWLFRSRTRIYDDARPTCECITWIRRVYLYHRFWLWSHWTGYCCRMRSRRDRSHDDYGEDEGSF